MKRRLVFLLSINLLLVTFCIANGTRVAVIPWGTGDNQLGLQSGPELEHVGPLSFAIDSNNSVYFLDSINKRISVFDSKGIHQKIIGKNVIGSSLAVTDDGSVAVLHDQEVNIINLQGSVQNVSISPAISLTEGYGQHLRVNQGDIYSTQVNQHLKKAVQQNAGKFASASVTDTKFELAGLPDKTSTQSYSVEWINRHEADVKRSSGAVYPLTTNDIFGGLQVIGVDKDENIYVEVERDTPDNYVHLYIYKLNSRGQMVGTQEIPNLYETTVYKKTELLSDGTVLQMVTTPAGVEIWKWTF
jgi:hypothetical protein